MDFGVVVILAGILGGGFTLGMLVSVAGPRAEGAEAVQPPQVRLPPTPGSAVDG
jgi:hypothetical protein